MPVLEMTNLVKRREEAGASFELRVPRLVLEPGRFYGVAGPSGSGKSTLLDILALVLRPTSVEQFALQQKDGGVLRIDRLWESAAVEALAKVRKSSYGYVLQSGGLIGFLSVRQNLEVPFQLVGRAPDLDRIHSMAAKFGIEREIDKKPRHLSGGQRQRVAILRALMLQPTIILADEPTAALDQMRARQIAAEFRSMALEIGSTIVMVSHDRDLLGSVADRILGLRPVPSHDGTAISQAVWEDEVH